MGLLDAMVGRFFRDEKAGKVVAFPVDGRYRGYLVRSESEELKIRAFLKMYCFSELSLQLFSTFLVVAWTAELIYAADKSVDHFLRSGAFFMMIYAITVAPPYLLLWRTYKKALLRVVSAQDEVLLSGKSEARSRWIALAGLTVLVLVGLVLFYLVRAK